MKSRVLAVLLFLSGVLLFATRSSAQGCIGVMKPEFSTYSGYTITAMNGTTDTLSLSTTVDGYTQIGNTEYCNISGAIHTPQVNNYVNGSSASAVGSGESPYAYIDFTGTHSASVPDNGTEFEVENEAEVVCSLACLIHES